MRSEQEMFNTLLTFAKNDECIRAVTMEGSKLNKNVPKDIFQDFDITFFVSNIDKYKYNDDWLDIFGKRVIMQKPAEMPLFPPGNWLGESKTLIYLMIFEDGNKMDLKLTPLDELELYFKKADSLCKILLDKDNICTLISEPSDIDFHVKKPSEEFIDNCSNEFWWLSTYVMKGLCRNEFLYAIENINLMKKQLFTMISWKVGVETSFSLSVGKSYKYLDKYVSKEIWEKITRICKNDTIDSLWDALIMCCSLFQETEDYVSNRLGYKCPEYNKNVIEYIQEYIPKNKLKNSVNGQLRLTGR
jgi:aminoglycoside 6-adenylyltransferase